MGAGILPIADHKGEIYIMLGRETADVKLKDSKKWSDFGGGAEFFESDEECAAREGYEETMGMFGNQGKLLLHIKEYRIMKINLENYTSYVLEVPYDKTLPNRFESVYKCVKRERKSLIKEKNGFFEKDRVKWIALKKFKNEKRYRSIRPFYRAVIKILYKELYG
jgi:hypothetical protein